jgi:hypothetical protein
VNRWKIVELTELQAGYCFAVICSVAFPRHSLHWAQCFGSLERAICQKHQSAAVHYRQHKKVRPAAKAPGILNYEGNTMTKDMKLLIESRARKVFPYLHVYLSHEDPSDPHAGSAFRLSFLLLRGPKEFLHTFRNGEMHIDPEGCDEVYFRLRDEMPGPSAGLMHEERMLIQAHNQAVETYRGCPKYGQASATPNERMPGLLP